MDVTASLGGLGVRPKKDASNRILGLQAENAAFTTAKNLIFGVIYSPWIYLAAAMVVILYGTTTIWS